MVNDLVLKVETTFILFFHNTVMNFVAGTDGALSGLGLQTKDKFNLYNLNEN